MVQSQLPDTRIDLGNRDQPISYGPRELYQYQHQQQQHIVDTHMSPQENMGVDPRSLPSWHIPRPSLVGRSDKAQSESEHSNSGAWKHHHNQNDHHNHIHNNNQYNNNNNNHHHHHHNHHADSPSRGSTSSQGSNSSTRSAASGTLLLTAANLANLAAMHPPRITASKQPEELDSASVASSTHFTVVNGLGRPSNTYQKSWCARNQLTVLVCTMSMLFMLGLLAGVLYMDVRARGRYN